jgi:hypothetical protein
MPKTRTERLHFKRLRIHDDVPQFQERDLELAYA